MSAGPWAGITEDEVRRFGALLQRAAVHLPEGHQVDLQRAVMTDADGVEHRFDGWLLLNNLRNRVGFTGSGPDDPRALVPAVEELSGLLSPMVTLLALADAYRDADPWLR